MKRTKIFILSILLLIILLFAEGYLLKKASGDDYSVKVIFAAKNIEQGEVITQEMLKETDIPSNMVHSDYIKSVDYIIGKNALIPIQKDEMILKQKIGKYEDENIIWVLEEDNRLITIKFTTDQANGWILKKDMFVDIIYIPSRQTVDDDDIIKTDKSILYPDIDDASYLMTKRVKNIRIATVLYEKEEPVYIMFEAPIDVIEFLAYAKGNGRLEIVSPGEE